MIAKTRVPVYSFPDWKGITQLFLLSENSHSRKIALQCSPRRAITLSLLIPLPGALPDATKQTRRKNKKVLRCYAEIYIKSRPRYVCRNGSSVATFARLVKGSERKLRGRGRIDSGAAFSMRYYALCTTRWKKHYSGRRFHHRRYPADDVVRAVVSVGIGVSVGVGISRLDGRDCSFTLGVRRRYT